MEGLSLLTVSVCTPVSAVTSNSLALFGKCQVYKNMCLELKEKMASNDPGVSDCNSFAAKSFVRF